MDKKREGFINRHILRITPYLNPDITILSRDSSSRICFYCGKCEEQKDEHGTNNGHNSK